MWEGDGTSTTMKKLHVTFENSEGGVAVHRKIACDICRDTGEYEPLDLEGYPSGDYQTCPVCNEGADHDPDDANAF